MYRKNQFTVYKQLTRFNEANDLYCTGWRPTGQSSLALTRICAIKDPTERFTCPTGRFRFLPKYSAVQTQVHKIYRENRVFWNKNKQGKPRLHNSIIPYLVQKERTFTAEDATVQQESLHSFSYITFSVKSCRRPTQAYEQQAKWWKGPTSQHDICTAFRDFHFVINSAKKENRKH